MNFSMHLIVVVAAAYLCRADAAPDEQLAREAQRPTRTFKPGFMAARGFGKRNLATTRTEQRDLDKFWTRLESYQREGLENEEGTDEPQSSSIPSEWFVREMLNNPAFARAVVMKFIDLNQDGMLSTDELLRNVKD